jgi:NAD(P)H-dependent FMN reductase
MKKIITLAGSNSKSSINKQLAEYTGSTLFNVEIIAIDLNDFEMPLYSIDIENEVGFSESAKRLNKLFESSDGFIVSLAEHNGAYSTAFKNVFDWLSRIEAKVWRDKPMILMSASPGGRGGQSVLEIASAKFPRMGANIVGSLLFPSFYDSFKNGEVVNEELKTNLKELVELFEKEI